MKKNIEQISDSAFFVRSYSTTTLVGVAPYTGACGADIRSDDDADDLRPEKLEEDDLSQRALR